MNAGSILEKTLPAQPSYRGDTFRPLETSGKPIPKTARFFCIKDPSSHLLGIIISSFNLNSLETADTELVYRSWRVKLCISSPSLLPSPAVLTSVIFLHCAKDLPTLSPKYCLFRVLPPLVLYCQVLQTWLLSKKNVRKVVCLPSHSSPLSSLSADCPQQFPLQHKLIISSLSHIRLLSLAGLTNGCLSAWFPC